MVVTTLMHVLGCIFAIFFFIYFNYDYKINEAILSDPNFQVSENKRYKRGH